MAVDLEQRGNGSGTASVSLGDRRTLVSILDGKRDVISRVLSIVH